VNLEGQPALAQTTKTDYSFIMIANPDKFLRDLFGAAVDAAMPQRVMAAYLPPQPKGRCIVIGAGKASAAMALSFEQLWQGPLSGLVVTRYGHAVACEKIEIVEAGHPVPDDQGLAATTRILDLVSKLGPDDLVVALISGGGSALLSLPAEGISLADKRAVNQALLQSGAAIDEMNCVRKHLSRIKGGRLAVAAHPARIITLAISDVPGDDPSIIASGPTVPDATSYAEARAIIAKYGIAVPPAVARFLQAAKDETPKPQDPRFAMAETHIIASPQMSLLAAAAHARSHGITPVILGDAIEGEARDVGKVMAGIALQVLNHGQPAKPPCVLLSGGETTVTVRGSGSGGRNVEYLLALALKLNGASGIHALAADTDGIDGGADIAGALIAPDTLQRARALGLDAAAALANNDGHGFFGGLGDQVITGPTRTNVNDFRAILVQ
jgi:glycerate 2-kinase